MSSGLISQCNVGYVSEDGVDSEMMESLSKDRESVWTDGGKANKIVRHSVEMTSYRFVYGENANEVEWKVINIRIDNSTCRPSNCTELAPVGCNTQTLEALK